MFQPNIKIIPQQVYYYETLTKIRSKGLLELPKFAEQRIVLEEFDIHKEFEKRFSESVKKAAEILGYPDDKIKPECPKFIGEVRTRLVQAEDALYSREMKPHRKLLEGLAELDEEGARQHGDSIKTLYNKMFRVQPPDLDQAFNRIKNDFLHGKHVEIVNDFGENIVRRKELFGANLAKAETAELLNKHIAPVAGLAKITKLIAVLVACTGVTAGVTRYLGKAINKTSEIVQGKPLVKEPEKTPEEKKGDKIIDTALIGSVGVAGGLAILNFIKGKDGSGIVTNALKGMYNRLNIDKGLDMIFKPIRNQVNKVKQWSADQMGHKADGQWLNRSIMTNLFMRVLITLPTGQYYNTIRCVVDEVLALSFLKGIDKSGVVGKLRKHVVAPFFNKKPRDKGAEFIADQGIKNIGIVCILMGLMNNAISSRIFKMLPGHKDKNKMNEDQYQKFRSRFIQAHHLDPLDKLSGDKAFVSVTGHHLADIDDSFDKYKKLFAAAKDA